MTATYSGIRPVVDTGKQNPSKESREHVLWDENGLLTVSGGKLTTFRIMARDALKAVRRHLGHIPFDPDVPVLDVIPPEAERLVPSLISAPRSACACWHVMVPGLRRYFLQLAKISSPSVKRFITGLNSARQRAEKGSSTSTIYFCVVSGSDWLLRREG